MVNPDDYSQRKSSRGYVWLKLFTDLLDEPTFMRLADQAKAVYFEVYLLAGKSDAFGLVTVSDKPATVQDIAWILHRSVTDLEKALYELDDAGLVELSAGLINEDDFQTTITRFAKEQGPSMDEKREQWARDQRKSRARAKGEKLPDEPVAETKSDAEKNKKSDVVKDLKTDSEQEKELKTTTKTKSVSRMSDNSQDGVSPDNGGSSSFNEYTDDILSVWQKKTGKKASKSMTFLDMCRYWFNEQVTIGHVTEAIDLVQTYAEPNTPMYLREVVINLKNNGPKNTLDKFRELYEQQKKLNGGDE